MNINNFLDLNSNDIIKFLTTCNNFDKKRILSDDNFRRLLLSDFGLLISLVNILGDDLNYLCDDAFARLIVNEDNVICISNLMMCSNNRINDFLSKNIIIDYIYDNIDDLKYFLSSKTLSFDFTKRFFNYLLLKDASIIKYIMYFDTNNQSFMLDNKRFSSLEEKLRYNIANMDYTLGLLPNYLNLYRQASDDDFLASLQELSKKDLFLMISEYFFNLKPYELKTKIKMIIEYTLISSERILTSYKLKIYSLILNFDDLSSFEIKRLYESLDGIDLEDDYSKVCNACYKQLSDCLFRNETDVLNQDLSKIYKRNVYTLNGESFFMLVHSTTINRDAEIIPSMSSKTTYSCSLISDKHLLTYQDASKNVVFGYNDFDINNIIAMYETNAFSNFENQRVPRLFSPDDLINNTRGFNEIIYEDRQLSLKPSYVICYDEIKIGDLMASKSFGNIPLVLVNTMAYRNDYYIDRKK